VTVTSLSAVVPVFTTVIVKFAVPPLRTRCECGDLVIAMLGATLGPGPGVGAGDWTAITVNRAGFESVPFGRDRARGHERLVSAGAPSSSLHRRADGTGGDGVSNESVRSEWAARFGRGEPKIVCVGLNYRDHAGEQGVELPKAPLLFGKFANTLCGEGDAIVLPDGIGHVDAEAELAVVIGRVARAVLVEAALEVVAGYACANDVSARDAQFGDGQWFRGKGFDSFCPVGPAIVPADGLDVGDLRIVQRLNGEVLQDSRTSRLIFGVPELVSYVSHAVTLEPGDLILTGTPEGVGVFREPKVTLRPGDVVEVEIEGVGVLRNPVEAAAS
jgi:2-keto-4-pentenoate hydratase/2-oxohepta-3-ene-1,7-dioic acid hydratase in catechol pathway